MVGQEGGHPLKPVETLRAMVALRDSNPSSTAKRFYALAKPGTANGRVARYVLGKEAFTIDILINELGIPQFTLYPIVREFVSWGIIHNSYGIDIGQSGARARMYVLDGAHPSRVAEAHKFHLELRSTPSGELVQSPLRQLVAPIVEGMIEDREIVSFGKYSCIKLNELNHRFLEEHGYLPDDLTQAAKKVIEEHGYKMIQER